MYRVSPVIFQSRNILYRCRAVEIRAANLSLSPGPCKSSPIQERKPCPPPELPPPEPQDNRLKIGLFLLALITGYCTVYAKKSPEIRDWLSINLPWFDDFIAVAYQENMTYQEFVKKSVMDLQDYWAVKQRPRPCSSDGQPVPPCDPPTEQKPRKECKPDEQKAPIDQKPRKECLPDEQKGAKEGEKPRDVLPAPVITTDLCEFEECLREHGESAVNNYTTARDACRLYIDTVQDALEHFTLQGLKSLEPAMEERNRLVKEHGANGDEAWASLNDLEKYIDCGMKAPKDALMNTKLLLKDFQAKINTVHAEYLWEEDIASAMDGRWQLVKGLVDTYTEENETCFPSVKYDSPKPQIQDDVDLLLIHTLRYEKKLRRIMEEMAAGMTERVNRGLETLPPPKDDREKKAREQLIQSTLAKRKVELDKWYKKRLDDLKALNDKILNDSLKAQCDRHEETMQIKLKQKEDESTIALNKMAAEAVAAEKRNFARDLADMSKKLNVVEDKLTERLKAEREARRSQEMWAAGASLLAATKKGESRICVEKELKALEKAAGDDKLVKTVLKSISDDVRKDGVVPESVLRNRYHNMEQVALGVALVEQEGAPMPVYIMSYIQSILLFMKLSGIPKADIEKPMRENMEDLDTFDILQRARYWIEQGDMAAALRYVGSLEGASRAAAASWHDDAKAHLEIKQAAEAVLAHAAALGLQYV